MILDDAPAPLILTARLEYSVQQYFNELRKKHFPPERNYLDAHLTLFHHLPANQEQIISDIKAICHNQAVFTLSVSEVVSIGNGTAFKIVSADLMKLHHDLKMRWAQWLIPQDKQKLWPHITIQNKVNTVEAKALKDELNTNFEPFNFQSPGLSLWRYLNGPWEFVGDFDFTG